MRYIGCKTKLLPFLRDAIAKVATKDSIVFDACSGTGTVAEMLKDTYTVLGCDLLVSCSILTTCNISIGTKDLPNDIDTTFTYLNSLAPVKGFVYKTYSPHAGRMYFTEENSMIIDAILEKLAEYDGIERTFFIGCLLESVSLVANTSGTYGAYNKKWDPRAEKKLVLANHFALKGSSKNKVFHGNVNKFLREDHDILYIDPPYNNRQYGSYYHVLETIARGDTPPVHGITGMRDWKDTKSNFCIPKLVEAELRNTIANSKAKHVILSYNNEGLLKKDTILELLHSFGTATCEEIPYDRYTTSKKTSVIEYIFTLTKSIPDPLTIPMWHNHIYNDDCLEGMKRIPSKSVQLILTDLPYGLTECKWDSPINLELLWEQYKRVISHNGAIVLFGQQPFTSRLIASNYEMFKYSLVWKKSKTGNFAQAPYRFLSQHEDIAVFSYGKVAKNGTPRMTYYPQGTMPCNKVMKGKSGSTEHREGRETQEDYMQTVTNYPRSILEFSNEGKPIHPTQKPVDLCEYLIRTYTKEGEVVLDSCIGAGTTAIAAINTKRVFVGFEKDVQYHTAACKRVSTHTGKL